MTDRPTNQPTTEQSCKSILVKDVRVFFLIHCNPSFALLFSYECIVVRTQHNKLLLLLACERVKENRETDLITEKLLTYITDLVIEELTSSSRY